MTPRRWRLLAFALALVAVVSLVSCSGGQRRYRASKAGKKDRFVAVRYGAWLHSAPDDKAPRARSPAWAGRKVPLGFANLYRLLHAGPTWLEVDGAADEDMKRHCLYRNSGLSRLQIRLYVKRSDAVRVTRRRVRESYKDRTFIELAAGAPVRRLRDHRKRRVGLYRASVRPFRLETFLPDAATGYFYTPSRLWENTESDHYVRSKARLRFGGTGIVRTGRYPPTLWIQSMSSDTVHPRVVIQKGCLRMKVIVSDKDIKSAESGGGLGMLGTTGGGKGVVVHLPKGTALMWPDGVRAGSVFKKLPVYGSIETRDGLTCFNHSLAPRWGPYKDRKDALLPLCVASADWPVPLDAGGD